MYQTHPQPLTVDHNFISFELNSSKPNLEIPVCKHFILFLLHNKDKNFFLYLRYFLNGVISFFFLFSFTFTS